MEDNIHYMDGAVANEGRRWALTSILESFIKMTTVLNEIMGAYKGASFQLEIMDSSKRSS